MSDLRNYNLKYEDVLSHINTLLEANRAYYRVLHIRCAAVVQNEKWRNALCLIRALPTEPPRSPLGNRRYANVHLLESYADLSYLGQLIRELPTGTLAIGGESIYAGERPEFHGWDLWPSHNDYADLPGYSYQSSNSSLTGALPQEPLVDFNMPFYRDVYDAVRDWIGLRQFHNISDARIGYALLFLPECRARLEDVKASGSRLRIKVMRGVHHNADKLRLTGSWSTSHGPLPISLPVANSVLSTQVPNDATEVDLYLVDENGAVLDYHRETPFWTLGKGRILPLSSSAVYEGLPSQGAQLEVVELDSKITPETRQPRRVFIVHGHDETNLLRLKEMLEERFRLEPVILRSRPAKGRTLIEKFEQEAYPCDFAFVLMSPDDHVQVKRKGRKGKYVQARPNVLFEMGWLCRHHTRGRVCILSKRGTSIHSDLAGVELIEFVRSIDEVMPQIERELVAAELLRPK
jgi:predicted nucleotide-binding protein